MHSSTIYLYKKEVLSPVLFPYSLSLSSPLFPSPVIPNNAYDRQAGRILRIPLPLLHPLQWDNP